mgnify:CR=1 FL=1
MTYPTISTLPTPPSRQRPSVFAEEADAFLGSLPTFQSEVNAAGDYVETKASEAQTSASNAATSESNAEESATEAAASAIAAALEASEWVSGASYSEGDVVWSSVNYATYRAKTNHSGLTTDPSSDTTNWALVAANSLNGLGVTASASELNILDGATVSTGELNTLNGITATTTELNILDGASINTSELNTLDGITATTAELNILSGVTASTSELNILDGATFSTGSNGEFTFSDGVNEGSVNLTSVSNSVTVDCSDGNVFDLNLTEDTTFSFVNEPPNGIAYSFTLKLVQDSSAREVTWPSSVNWPKGVAPTLSDGSGEVDVFVFYTNDGGANWYGFTAGQGLV